MKHIHFILIFLLAASPFVYAGGEHGAGKEPLVSSWTSQHLNKVNELLANEKYVKAREKLDSLLSSLKGDKYETGLANQAYAYSYALQEDYKTAILYFEKALPSLEASFNQTQKTRYDLGQLYMAEEHYEKAIRLLEAWLKHTEKKSAQVHILLGNAYAQVGKNKQAIPHVRKAIQRRKEIGKEPQEPWYQLLLSLYLDIDNYQASVKLLPEMITLFPKTDIYWKQLGAMHLQLKDFKQGAAALEIAWQRGLLKKEAEVLRLAYLLLHLETPDKAARLLVSSLDSQYIESNEKHWRLLSDAWLLARETDKAVSALVKAASYADSGNLNERVARILVDQGEWQKAQDQLRLALDKGDLKHPGNCYLLLGIAATELDQTDQARKAFTQASKHKKTKKSATQWLKLLDQSV